MKRLLVLIMVALATAAAVLRPDIGRDPLPQASFMGISQDNCVTNPALGAALDKGGRFSVLVWNIHKQSYGRWPEALWLTDKTLPELILLQEVKDDPGLISGLTQRGYEWLKMGAFRLLGNQYGVMNAALARPVNACGWLNPEPWLRLPKSALLGHYPLSNGQMLLVINLHGINFDFALAAWQQQINALLKEIAGHRGPVIFAGDFNSWGEDRSRELAAMTARLGLKEMSFKPDLRGDVLGSKLDHLFYRGLRPLDGEAPATRVSDHSPLLVHFALADAAG